MWFFVTAVTETYRWSGWTSSSFVIDIFFVCKMFHNFNIACDYLLMLTIFHVENVLIILNWCLCDLLLVKHIDEVDGLPSSFVTYWCWHIFCVEKYSTTSILLLIIYWCWLFFMWKMFLSFSTDVYVIFCYWNISMKWMDFILICHWHIFCVKNIPQFQYCFWLFTNVDYFSCGKCSYHSQLMFMWFSCTKTYWWSGCTSSSFVIYCFWLFTDVDFFHVKMFLSFSTDVYVIFCYWNISMKWMDFILICHWHIFLCVKYSTISILFLTIY